MITKKNLPNHEIIGLQVEITESKNKSLIGKKGKIIDETKHTIRIRTKNGEKKIIKKDSTFKFKVGTKTMSTNGEILTGNPWERLKKKLKVKNRWQTLE